MSLSFCSAALSRGARNVQSRQFATITETLKAQFRQSNMRRVPMNLAFVDFDAKADAVLPARSPQISKTANGVRVVSVQSATANASVALLIDSGSRYENPEISGISSFVNSLFLKSTKKRSDFMIVRELQKHGVTVQSSLTKETTMYSGDCLQTQVPFVFDMLADSLTNHAFDEFELAEVREATSKVFQEQQQSGQVDSMEAIHRAAYSNDTLGLPVHGQSLNLNKFTPELLKQWVQTHYVPSRMVVAGYGVEHSQLVKLTEQYFGSLSDGNASAKRPAKYLGGEFRSQSIQGSPTTTFTLGFETANWSNEADLIPMCVLQQMMGGGDSFSAGGPGKGMYTRLYQNVLNSCGWAHSAFCMNAIYADSGLFCLTGQSDANNSHELVMTMVKEAIKMAGPVGEEELQRAKNQLKSNVLMQLENRAVQIEDMAKQVLLFNKVEPDSRLTTLVDKVTAADVNRVAMKMLLSPISISTFGDVTRVPRYDIIANYFK